MMMTNEEIKQANEDIQNIEKLDDAKKQGAFIAFAKDHNILLPTVRSSPEFRNEVFANIHTFLQSKMMLNACVSAEESGKLAKQSCSSAKWSCFWAATAAIAACVSTVVMLCSR